MGKIERNRQTGTDRWQIYRQIIRDRESKTQRDRKRKRETQKGQRAKKVMKLDGANRSLHTLDSVPILG